MHREIEVKKARVRAAGGGRKILCGSKNERKKPQLRN
jgi:hypothetical protein